jgi:hypothetical protein
MAFPNGNSKNPWPVSGERNGSSSCVLSREFFYIALRMGSRITADLMAVTGESPIADLDPGKYIAKSGFLKFDDGGWSNSDDYGFTAKPLTETATGTKNAGDLAAGFQEKAQPTNLLHTSKPIKLGVAKGILEVLLFNYQSRVALQMAAMNNYRTWRVMKESERICARAYMEALKELGLAVLPQRRRERGMQEMMVRRWEVARVEGGIEYGERHGKMAWRKVAPRGRKPLTEYQWRRRWYRRYCARVVNPGSFEDVAMNVKVPAAYHGRPKGAWPRKRRKVGVDGNQSPQLRNGGNVKTTVERAVIRWVERVKDQFGEAIEDTVKDAVKEWWNETNQDMENRPFDGSQFGS